jgi:alpha-L-fucosidase
MGKPVIFNVVQICEYLPLGQRIDSFAVDCWNNDKWEEFADATSIGSKRLLATRYITTSKVRVRITKAAACPAISDISLFASPVQLSNPVIRRDRKGDVTIACDFAGPWIRYTTDGSEPTENSKLFEKSFAFTDGGTIKARAFLPEQKQQSAITTETFNKIKGK